jgi:predicted porin
MFRSFRAAVLAACAAAGCSGALGQNVALYGLIDAAVSRSRAPGGESGTRLDSGDMSLSYFGFRGSEELGGGLRAVFRLESYLRLDTGQAGRFAGDGFFGRDANAGLSGAFGTTVLGRNVTPLYLATASFNPFGDSLGFSPSMRQYYGGTIVGDRSWNNSLAYTNNATGSRLRVHFAVNLPEDPVGAAETGRNYGLGMAYISGPFAATLVAERIKNSALPLPAGFQRQRVIQAGAAYDFALLRVYGQIGQVETDASVDTRTTLYQLGATVPIGTGFALVAYGHSQTHAAPGDTHDRTTSLGYDYFLSKNLDVYVAAMLEQVSNLSSGQTLAGGIRLRF